MVSAMIGVTARVKVKPGKEAAFEAFAKEVIDAVRANEPGNLFYSLFRTERQGEYVFMERWKDQAAVDAHGKAPHMKAALPRFGEFVDGPVELNQYEEIEPA
ncbi:MAG: antibiotic biosynthesis monooxygenase [Alphaproteobacteria bacterium]|nr:antibiotic biosynthesis monooxygenase [Alphaproteobacteria bacterium]